MDVLCDPISIFSLRKSKARRVILRFLVKIHPKKSYASEIARHTRMGINEVHGALNGVRNRYKKEHSLVALHFVKKERKDALIFYSATELGRQISRSLIR